VRDHVSMPSEEMPVALAETHEVLTRGPITLLLRRDWKEALPVEAMLEGSPLAAWGVPVEHGLSGRGPVHVLRTSRGEIVAKAYSRGGLIGGVLRHWYMDAKRPLREAAVAEELMRRDCPTPPVVAARITRGVAGLVKLEIATARVEGARDLLNVLQGLLRGEFEEKQPVGNQEDVGHVPSWDQLAVDSGQTLRMLHDAGLHHRDLQVKNLLVPSVCVGEVPAADRALVVLDLDRCSVGEPPSHVERVRSLARFARSLVKSGLLPGLARKGRGFELRRGVRLFISAYGALPGVRRSLLLHDVRVRLQKSLRTHEVLWNDPLRELGGGNSAREGRLRP